MVYVVICYVSKPNGRQLIRVPICDNPLYIALQKRDHLMYYGQEDIARAMTLVKDGQFIYMLLSLQVSQDLTAVLLMG